MSRRRTATRKSHKSRKSHVRRRRMMYGGESPASVNDTSMNSMQQQSLAQGRQFETYHANQHGGASLEGGPFPGVVTEQSLLPQALHASARIAPLDAAISAIQNLKDQSGGRRRKSRKASKKSRKGRKSMKGGKKSRKGRKASRKATTRRRRMHRGGAYSLENAQSVNAPGMLLDSAMEAKALGGMNAEWKLAENPMAFAPGYKQ